MNQETPTTASRNGGRRRAEATSSGRSESTAGLDLGEIWHEVRGFTQRKPYTALGVALASGYVLGGGLFSALTARLLGTGLRMGFRVLGPVLVRQEIMSVFDRGSGDSSGHRENPEDDRFVEKP